MRIPKASVAQLVEQLTLNQFVHGSSPCGGRCFHGCDKNSFRLVEEKASVAQLVEQLTLNQFVHGSSPCGGR